MGKLLLVIDYQADFVSEEGRLTVGPPALAIEDFIDRRVEDALAGGWDVVFTQDTHTAKTYPQSPEGSAFPLHCERGTPGWQIFGRPARHLAHPLASLVEKKAYCPSFRLLDGWVRDYEQIQLMGVVTNICVLHTAVGLYTAKLEADSPVRLTVLEGGCASFDPDGHAFALRHMVKTLGMGQ